MTDNSEQRLHAVFFYGLYMYADILKQKGVAPRKPRRAKIHDFALRIGLQATLLRAPGKTAYGLVYMLTHGEIDALYRGAGLVDYAPEALPAEIEGQLQPVLCCNLIVPPETSESNVDYQTKLEAVMKRLNLPFNPI